MTQLFQDAWPSLELLESQNLSHHDANPKWPEIQDQLLWEVPPGQVQIIKEGAEGF